MLVLAAFGFVRGAAALSASPMVVEMESVGAQTRATLTVENPDARTMSVEIETLALSIAEDGEATYTPDDESLIVFPPIASIGPGASQVFQVQYVGDPELAASESFRLSILQVPVELDDEASTISVATNIHALVNVAPPGSSADLDVVSVEPSGTAGEWVVSIRNAGNRHARLTETLWQIRTPTKDLMFSRAEISRYVRGVHVPPNATRSVRLTPPDDVDLAGAQITIAVPN